MTPQSRSSCLSRCATDFCRRLAWWAQIVWSAALPLPLHFCWSLPRLHVLGRDQPYFMPRLSQRPSRSALRRRFAAKRRSWGRTASWVLLSRRAYQVQPDECCLTKVNADDVRFHGMPRRYPLLFIGATSSLPDGGGQVRRRISASV
jgi:hypothetical protein